MTTRLKIKIKSLAAEATIIRKEESKALRNARYCSGYRTVDLMDGDKAVTRFRKDKAQSNGPLLEHAKLAYELYNCLREHRIKVVRQEARLSQLAYGFLRGRTYKQIENTGSFKTIDFPKVIEMIGRFSDDGAKPTPRQFSDWMRS